MKLGKKPGQYDIGYGKPPVSSRFRKGLSGNPKGRPKRAGGLDESLAEKLDGIIWIERDGRRERVTKRELGIIVLIRRALKGEIGALRKVFTLVRQLEPRAEKEAFKIVVVPDSPEAKKAAADALRTLEEQRGWYGKS